MRWVSGDMVVSWIEVLPKFVNSIGIYLADVPLGSPHRMEGYADADYVYINILKCNHFVIRIKM